MVILDPAAAYAFLTHDADDGFAEDLRFGASILHLRHLADYATDIVVRGRTLPSFVDAISDDPNEALDLYRARWRPVIQGQDLVTLQEFIAATPPVGRCELHDDADRAGQDPARLVWAAVESLVDAAVRDRAAARSVSALDGTPNRRGRLPKTLPAAEAWLGALTSPDGMFTAGGEDAARLSDSLVDWDEFGTGAIGPARATFRLSEVALEDAHEHRRWRVEFWLQSVQDPSLLVAADQVWAGGTGLDRWLERPDELLLTELGRAASIYPDLTDAMRQARPLALELDSVGAHDFLTLYAGLLDQAGFGVHLPSWWATRSTLTLTGRASTQVEGGITEGWFTRGTLCDFNWQLALGETVLTAEELQALAATKEPLVRLRGEWVSVDAEQLARALEFITRRNDDGAQMTAGEVIALAAAGDREAPLPVGAVEATGLLGDFLDGTAAATVQPVPTPAGLEATLRPYQERGLAWLAFLSTLGLGACLADDMGLGKTIQLLALETHEREHDSDSGPTLLLCPMSLVGNWQREAARFAPHLRVYAHHGPARARGADLEAQLEAADLVVTTYQTAVRDEEELAGRTWRRLVLDEAQAIKNHLARASKTVRKLRAEHRVALTGTPMENKLAELWSIMDVLNPGILGSLELFRTAYAHPIERYGQTEPATRLRAVTRPYILRRLKTDANIAPDLPDKIEIKQYCNLTIEQASLYQSVVNEMMPKIEQAEGIERRGNVLATMTKLKQVCNHPAQLLHDRSPIGNRSGKIAGLHEILEEILEAGEKVLLFTQYTEFANMLMPHLSARYNQEVAYLHGKTPKAGRDDLVERFQGEAGPSMFLLSLKAGGTGLTLTAANHVIHLDRWWNPAVENQATDRAFRIGQKHNVQVRKFITTGTLEERIDDMIEQKKQLADLVVGDGEAWLTDLSTTELRKLFELSQEAVGE